LKAGAIETIAYSALFAAAAIRVFLPLLLPASLLLAVWASAFCWMLAFALYLWRYGPMLCRPRVDGLPG